MSCALETEERNISLPKAYFSRVHKLLNSKFVRIRVILVLECFEYTTSFPSCSSETGDRAGPL